VPWAGWQKRVLGDRGPDVAVAVLTVATVLVLVCFVLDLWDANPSIPFDYGGDATFNSSVVKDVIDHGMYYRNPDLGAPLGQELYDFPGVDALNLVLIRGLGVLSSSPGLVLNLFFLLTFPLSALTALFVLRKLGIARGPAFVASVLFAFLPYHFAHGEAHVFTSAYYIVPLSAYLILAILGGRPLFGRHDRGGPWRIGRFATRRSLWTVLICVAVASCDVYYACFSVLLVTIATLLASSFRRSLSTLAAGAAVLAVIAAAMLANFAPAIAYFHTHGRDPQVAQRVPQETEIYALKLANLLLPVDGHRFAAFADLKRRYDTTTVLPENSQEGAQTLGLLGTIGFVWLVAVAIGSTLGNRGLARSLHGDAAAATLAAFLIGTTGGISTLIAYLVSPQLRSWGRISVFIAFFSFLALALLLDWARKRFSPTGWRAWAFAGMLGALVVFGIADQTTNRMIPTYAVTGVAWRSDDAFVKTIEQRLPGGADIYQLPYVSFPEGAAPGQTGPYDQLRLYLHSSHLRWSAGAMRGRPADDWQARLANSGIDEQVRTVAAIGFSGIVVDRFGYSDGGSSVEQQLARLVGSPSIVSFNQRLSFFDLREYDRRLRTTLTPRGVALLRDATLYPLGSAWRGGFSALQAGDNHTWYWSTAPQARVDLTNPAPRPRTVTLTVLIHAAKPAPGSAVQIAFPDGSTVLRRLPAGNVKVEHGFRLPPGKSSIEFSTTAPAVRIDADPGTFYLQFLDPAITDREDSAP